jgi:hypothetical protein
VPVECLSARHLARIADSTSLRQFALLPVVAWSWNSETSRTRTRVCEIFIDYIGHLGFQLQVTTVNVRSNFILGSENLLNEELRESVAALMHS